MTPTQLTALKAEITARADCTAMVAAKDCNGLAALVSIGRTAIQSRFVTTRTIQSEISNGAAILEKLDAAQATYPDLKYALVFLKQDSGYDFGVAKAQAMADQLAAVAVITTVDAAALKGLASLPAPVTARQVAVTLFNDDGTPK